MTLGYSTVRLNVTALVIDGVDSDDLPDDVPLSGRIILSPMIQTGRTIQYDEGGKLKLKALTEMEVDIGATGDISHRNRDYVKVVAPSAATTNMSELQWKATFKDLKYGTKSTSIDPIYFYAVPDAEINLADHVNVAPNSTAIQLSRGPRGFGVGEVIDEAGELVFLLDDVDATEVGRVAIPEAEVSDEAIAEKVLAPDSATKAALDGTYAPSSVVTDVAAKVTKPAGGFDGQVLARSGTSVVWATPAAGSAAGVAAMSNFGDSVTAAGQGGGIKWHELVSDWLGIPAFNPSVPGEAPADIAVRQGGLAPALTLTGDSIPAATDPIVVTTISPSSGYIASAPGNAARGAFTGRLCGVAGTLKHDQTTGVWTFTRTAAGTVAISCPPASIFRVDDSKPHRGDIQTFWGGRNGNSTLLRDTASMVAYLNAPKRFLVFSILTSGADVSGSGGYTAILARNAQLAAAYPDNYFDMRGYLIASGLSDAGITPTSQDAIDIAADTVPASLRDDSIHPNAIGHWVIARKVAQLIVAKGWVDPASVYIPAALGMGTAPVVTTTSVPAATIGSAYSTTLAATGSTPLTWSVLSGTLPTGLTLSTSGVLSGTPTAGVPATFTVRATNSAGLDDQVLTIEASTPAGPTKLDLPTSAALASLPASTELRAATNLSIRLVGHFDSLVSQGSFLRRLAVAGDQRSWQLLSISSQKLRFQMFQSGTATPVVTVDSTLSPTYTPGDLLGLRVDFNAATRQVSFYTSGNGVDWTQLGTTVTGAGTSTTIFAGTAPVEIAGFAGDVTSLKILSLDGTVTYVDEDFTDSATAGWTLSGGAVVV